MSKQIHQILMSKYSNNKTVTRVLETNGCLVLKKKKGGDLFLHLSRTVTGQQLSKVAANTIWGRIESLADKRSCDIYSLFEDRNFSLLRGCGLSKSKIRAILELRSALENGAISNEIYDTQDQNVIISEISKLWGFGRWTAEMSALFFFGLPDVWAEQDAALKRAITEVSNLENTSSSSIVKKAAPYRSYLALHLWKANDTRILRK